MMLCIQTGCRKTASYSTNSKVTEAGTTIWPGADWSAGKPGDFPVGPSFRKFIGPQMDND